MPFSVIKFGGSSLADENKILSAAKIAVKEYESGNSVIAVVSAMGNTTNELISKLKFFGDTVNRREEDVLLSAGEQISASLFATAINSLGVDAVSLLGFQIQIKTTDDHTDANIVSIDTNRLTEETKNGKIVVVAGFQGVNKSGDITTLGRGGSDTSAVALAAALKAEKCIIYTDVDGVYTSDPNLDSSAQKLDFISYDEMIKMANNGAKVLKAESVKIAKDFGVKLLVRSTFKEGDGTVVG